MELKLRSISLWKRDGAYVGSASFYSENGNVVVVNFDYDGAKAENIRGRAAVPDSLRKSLQEALTANPPPPVPGMASHIVLRDGEWGAIKPRMAWARLK